MWGGWFDMEGRGMGHRALLVTLTTGVALLLAGAGLAQEQATAVEVGVSPGLVWGTSTYGLHFSQQMEGVSGDVVAESELQWPLTSMDIGFDVSWRVPRRLHGHWGGWVRSRFAVGEPVGRMEDSDWLTAKGEGVDRTRISYTESKVKGGSLVADAGFYLSKSPVEESPPGGEWDLHFGYRHEAVYLEAWGVEDGWQMAPLGQQSQIFVDSHTEMADFDAHHLFPYAGVLYRVKAGKRFRCEIRGVGMGFVSVETDDHVLRSKKLQSLGWGLGALVGARPEWVFEKDKKSGKGASVSIGLGVEAQYARTLVGTMEQAYYDDDPGLPGDQSDQEIPDSDYFAQVIRVGGEVFLRVLF